MNKQGVGAAAAVDSRSILLTHLLDNKGGATVEELVAAMGLSRTAVIQQLTGLEREGYISRAQSRRTGGRPGRVYVLTDDGANQFPKKYSWFSALLLKSLRDQLGEQKFGGYMYDLGVQMSAAQIPRLVGKTRLERIVEIVNIMNETGFHASRVAMEEGEKIPRVQCTNCVYHDLSKSFPEVCSFDLGFLSGLMGAAVEHEACMQRGAEVCRFRFKPLA